MSIQTVVLSAGSSSRMGSPKALLDLDGKTFVTRIAATARAAGCEGVIVVLGPPDGQAIRAKLPPGAGSAWNPDPSRGMLSSVQTAVTQLPPRTTAILVWPVDQPLVSYESVRSILGAAPGKIVVPRHKGKGGHPVRIPRSQFGALAALDPADGLRALFERHPADVVYLDLDDPGITKDFDTPADLKPEPARKSK